MPFTALGIYDVGATAYEPESELYAFDFGITMPTDQRDGTVTGRRQHGTFEVTQEVSHLSPLLARHICENLEIPSVVIRCFKADTKRGDLIEYFSYTMKKVKVVSIRNAKPNTCDPASRHFRDMETVRFRFEELEIADKEGNEYTDTWAIGT